MNKKLVIKELEKARETLLDAEQLEAIDYAIKIFKYSNDLDILRIEAEHMALAFGERSDTVYGELLDTIRHRRQEDIVKLKLRNNLEQAKKEIENMSTYDGIYLDRADILKIIDELIERVYE